MLTDIIGYVAGFTLALCFAPQVLKTLRLKHADDISMSMLALNLTAGVLYEIYAWRLDLMPVVIMNGIFCVLVMVEICLKAHFDRLNKAAAA